jgi:branched-chain amino acid transport system substrate-binding protein
VIIGSNHPLSGSLSNTGERMDQAVKLAAMIKNEAGGIESLDGAELSVVSGDNEGARELGGEVAQELIDEGASVLTGCYSSPVTSAATRTAESAGVPFVISVSVANSILQETQLNYAYRPQPPANQMAVDHARLLADAIRNAGEECATRSARSSRQTTSRSSPRPPSGSVKPQTRRSRRFGTPTPTR